MARKKGSKFSLPGPVKMKPSAAKSNPVKTYPKSGGNFGTGSPSLRFSKSTGKSNIGSMKGAR
jgi:hypothetical protein